MTDVGTATGFGDGQGADQLAAQGGPHVGVDLPWSPAAIRCGTAMPQVNSEANRPPGHPDVSASPRR